MFKVIAAYLIGREIVGFIVCAAMFIALMAACLIAYAFVPSATADTEDSSYSYSLVVENNTSTDGGSVPQTESAPVPVAG